MEQAKSRYVKVSVPEVLHEEMRVEAARREVSLQVVALERLMGDVPAEQPSVPREQPRAPKSVPAEQPKAPVVVPREQPARVVGRKMVTQEPPKEVPPFNPLPRTAAEVTIPQRDGWAPRDFSKVTQSGRKEKK